MVALMNKLPISVPTKPTLPSFVGFVGCVYGLFVQLKVLYGLA